jgi:hypothetical protein
MGARPEWVQPLGMRRLRRWWRLLIPIGPKPLWMMERNIGSEEKTLDILYLLSRLFRHEKRHVPCSLQSPDMTEVLGVDVRLLSKTSERYRIC